MCMCAPPCMWLLQVHDGTLFVNGVARDEPFIYQKPAYTLGKLVVPPGDVSATTTTTTAADACTDVAPPTYLLCIHSAMHICVCADRAASCRGTSSGASRSLHPADTRHHVLT